MLDRGQIGGGTTGRGEGNILVSDKEPGPELALALVSDRLWRSLGAEFGPAAFELEDKGGLVVATGEPALAGLRRFAAAQGDAGVHTVPIPADGLHELEPHLAPGLPGGMHYPQDQQVQPVVAAAALLRAARGLGATVRTGRRGHRCQDRPATGP